MDSGILTGCPTARGDAEEPPCAADTDTGTYVARIIGGVELDEDQMLEWHLYLQAACGDGALADAVWMLAHEVRGGRWIPLGRLPSMDFEVLRP